MRSTWTAVAWCGPDPGGMCPTTAHRRRQRELFPGVRRHPQPRRRSRNRSRSDEPDRRSSRAVGCRAGAGDPRALAERGRVRPGGRVLRLHGRADPAGRSRAADRFHHRTVDRPGSGAGHRRQLGGNRRQPGQRRGAHRHRTPIGSGRAVDRRRQRWRLAHRQRPRSESRLGTADRRLGRPVRRGDGLRPRQPRQPGAGPRPDPRRDGPLQQLRQKGRPADGRHLHARRRRHLVPVRRVP